MMFCLMGCKGRAKASIVNAVVHGAGKLCYKRVLSASYFLGVAFFGLTFGD